ncbi:MarR family winged helix-turn-helix transcriptional regulator [Exiguobacterium alkaliphilum]|uniref:MarR family winged helix-turn-helix transcriptional regulator n=1 Tax=Exiguobacterium alkaliphilum TaxID=1428684 RepID=UPI001BA5E46B|nr:MarR family transcriptional regulator [Exiguobacterium alkaliphilum]QUE86652.1 MarR family transcriptional regulator [Exiguobacterium alkaliphilum]
MNKEELDKQIERFDTALHYNLKKISSKVSHQLEQGITIDQFFLLRMINQSGRITSSQLANELGVRPSAITVMIDRLIKNEFVTRVRDEEDRRVVFIALTENGQRVLKQSEEKRLVLIKKYMSKLEQAELKQFVLTFEKIARIIANYEEEKNLEIT